MKRHGLPGIGITAEKGKKGKDGPGFYFGPLDSFFVYIGDDILPDSSIDYEDIDYDITYVQNEKRLDPKYKVGDVLYITDLAENDKKLVMYMIEITDDLTTCTKDYLLRHITYDRPFTLKSSLDKHTYLYPITIADVSNYNNFIYKQGDHAGEQMSTVKKWETNLHNINAFVYNSLVSVNYYDASVLDVSKLVITTDVSVVMDQSTYNYIPYKYFSDDYQRQEIINDGKDIIKYTYPNIDISTNFISMTAKANTYSTDGLNQLLFYTQRDKGLFISTQNTNKLFIDNIYIRKDNIGNADAYYTLYNDNIALDNDGNCYTLTQSDFNSSIQGFVITPSKFLNRSNLDINDFNYGYVHTYWNYNEDSINSSTQKNTYYKPNYIRGNYMTSDVKTFYVYKTDEYGTYIRNWNDEKFSKVDVEELRQLLINVPENKTLFDVSYLIPSSVNQELREMFYDVSGIIQIQNIEDYVRYDKIQTIDTSVEYRDYGNTHLYYVTLNGDTEQINEYHDELIIQVKNPSLVIVQETQIVVDPVTGEPVIDPETGEPQTQIVEHEETVMVVDSSVIKAPDTSLVEKYLDVSYFSGIDMYTNPSNNMITLDKLDPNGLYYRHHEILQWIADPEGLKYYSNKTKVTYDVQSNSYIIEASWENTNKLTEYQKTSDNYPEPEFNIKIKDGKVYIDASNNGDQPYITKLGQTILENSNEMDIIAADSSDITRQYVYNSFIQPNSSTFEEILFTNEDKDLLNRLFTNNDDNFNVNDEYAIYEIPYYITDASVRTYEKKYITQIHINDYKDYRTLPVVNLDMYNDIERLEAVNNIENGVLCNQFQFFIDLNIEDFGYDNWGQMSEYIKNPLLRLDINIDLKLETPDSSKVSDFIKSISYGILMNNVDVYHTSIKDLFNEIQGTNSRRQDIPVRNLNDSTIILDDLAIQALDFRLDDAVSGTKRIWIFMETKNPEPLYIYARAYISALSVVVPDPAQPDVHEYDIFYELNREYLYNKSTNYYLYGSKPLKAVIAPISYIAGYNQEMDNISYINNKVQGSEEEVNIAIKPYKLDQVEQLYTNFVDRSEDSMVTNWCALKFKKRFLQDNIKALSISTININYIKNLIRLSDYTVIRNRIQVPIFCADDQDDIYETYLELVYNADLYKSQLIEDQEQFIYNGERYLSSKYDQLNNNTAIYVKQENEYEVRSYNLLNSMQKWNSIYPDYKYPSDNPYPGHIELYGNGYQYLAKSIDNNQYLQSGYMSLSDTKQLNNQYFFDTDIHESYVSTINKPDKNNAYTPVKLFRNLLYQMEWVYPRYYSENGINLIERHILKECTNPNNNDRKMPYNLAYSIYPRMLFNDEEQINVITMLRRPSIVKENQYKLTLDDIYIPDLSQIKDLTSPINVLD